MPNSELVKIDEELNDLEFRLEFGAQTIKYDLALALVEARRNQELTQTGLGELIHKSQPYISKLESGEANPTIGQVGAILASIWLKPRFDLEPLVSNMGSEEQVQLAAAEPGPSIHEDIVLPELARRLAGSADYYDTPRFEPGISALVGAATGGSGREAS